VCVHDPGAFDAPLRDPSWSDPLTPDIT